MYNNPDSLATAIVFCGELNMMQYIRGDSGGMETGNIKIDGIKSKITSCYNIVMSNYEKIARHLHIHKLNDK